MHPDRPDGAAISEGVRPARFEPQAAGRAQAARARIVQWVETLARSSPAILFFRTIGALAIALVACLVPEVGPNRFLLAGVLVGVCIPAAIWVERHHPSSETSWSQPLFDLVAVVTLVHLVPHMWFPALVIGLMIVQAPSVAEATASHTFYGVFALVLVVGMSLAAIVHDVPGWELPILAMTVLYPSVIFYSYRQSLRSSELSRRARALEGLQLIAGGVAHDFNNLLTSVIGNAELARFEIPETHPAYELLDDVVRGATRASLLSARLLAFSGRRPGPAEPLDVEAEVRDLVALLRPVVPKGVTLRLDSALGGERVLADRAQLQQIVMNVVINDGEAIASLPGEVAVHLRPRDVDGRDGVEVAIVDPGIGMPPEVRARIFDPFYTSKERGHGLGLASARTQLRELGGRIEVESEPGRGTKVLLLFPCCPHDVATRATPRTTSEPGAGTALVVDDEASVRAVTGRMLARLGYDVVEAESGTRAIERLRMEPEAIDVVLLDLRMPGMDGWTCLDALLGIRPGLPVIICSGHDPNAVAPARHHAVPRLDKPFPLDALARALEVVGRSADV